MVLCDFIFLQVMISYADSLYLLYLYHHNLLSSFNKIGQRPERKTRI